MEDDMSSACSCKSIYKTMPKIILNLVYYKPGTATF